MIIHAARFATFSTFLLRSYMVTIPRDFEDAALIDGATRLYAFASRFDRDRALTNAASVLMLAPAVILFLNLPTPVHSGNDTGRSEGLKRRCESREGMRRAAVPATAHRLVASAGFAGLRAR